MSFEVGDTVFDMQYGQGEVTEITDNVSYPVTICFLNNRIETYTVEGRNLNSFAMPTLYFKQPCITDIEPNRLPNLAVDTPILVRQKPDDLWRKAYFARWDLNDCVAWYEGRTSWSASNSLITIWSEWKLPEESSE